MTLNSFFQFFVPKEKKFFGLYQQQAKLINEASILLKKMILETDLDKLETIKAEIKKCETSGDTVLNDFNTQLNNTILTPFEREDVHHLAELMDNMLDRIDDAGNIILTRRFTDNDPDLITMADNIIFTSENILEIAENMEFMLTTKSKDASRLCREIKTIEHDCDEMYCNYINKLFNNNYKIVEIIKRKDLIQVLENTVNSAKYISDEIRGILAKMS